ncbi:MAG TPA: exodeoxyribonuclease VII small subunit [Bdellovibrionales bacterium]|nr:MAG: exodeoxyribonuclease VII small subunit [Bdellovibrionales bacterium GWB1_52_6]OFZ04403.1 MAG: exodeoxyribonuclease VII small subunit [Bdellovibrionales bacterium GWA1_52_35]HAR44144.1 exodeoxyribonuclease VII small subunit [Bdellovibrionales bacterium]HCM40741.1 exodeoxyribonuclease VII small subunit [Bdellovibrionales bacterium]
MTANTPESPSFEKALEQLQQTVKRLESGDLGLEDALKNFEDGVRLTRTCQQQLAVAEQRVDVLMKTGLDGSVETQPFRSGRNNP